MTKKMLIDATHDEETRVAVVENNRLIEFDYESKVRKQLKGNIYLAKVTRVEPSLQAAFVNFGGNRHGFLPFSEIHPDYFKIPVDDREALLEAQKAALEEHDEIFSDDDIEDGVETEDAVDDAGDVEEIIDEDQDDVEEVGGSDKPADEDDSDLEKPVKKTRGRKKPVAKTAKKAKSKTDDEAVEDESSSEEVTEKKPVKKATKKARKKPAKKDDKVTGNVKKNEEEKSDEELDAEAQAKLLEMDGSTEAPKGKGRGRSNSRGRSKGRSNMASRRQTKYGGKGRSSGKPFRFNLHHHYKIQEVVKRGQIMLIQVNKEERGNKGAAVTSYLSLPGRYCVLMPNSPRGGGVSRKIGHFKDRRKMRDILKELTVPEGMSVILRTAGVSRTKDDIKRDLDYLTRLWNTIREETLQSTAPALINEEGNLIKRSIRDIYTREIDAIEVAGEKGYKSAKKNMELLVPSHVKKVKQYDDPKVPLFHRYQVERQIADIGDTTATLKSGGYLVINPTEALVSIDVNSGKATKERHIEETALKTNLEAADEVARQLRLRDLGGLVVIDFIDMEDRRNNRKVEQRLKNALSVDRARIQVGRISSFGLLELSRQRLNPSLTEAQFEPCAHCESRGFTMTLDFAAITALRGVEEQGINGKAKEISLCLPNDVAVYILNKKRDMLTEIEARHEFRVHVRVDEGLRPSEYRIDVLSADGEVVESKSSKDKPAVQQQNKDSDGDDGKKKGRRRGRRGGRRRNNNNDRQENNQDSALDTKADEKVDTSSDVNVDDKKLTKKKSAKTAAKKSKKTDDKVVETKSAEKAEEKTAKKKQAPKVKKKEKTPKPSNDVKPSASAPERDASEYETVNAAPTKKKKGWWNRLVD